MRRLVLVGAVGIAFLAVWPVAVPGASNSRPFLRLAGARPLRVLGFHFAPAERVRVIVVAHERAVQRVRASTRGTFTATFRSVRIDRCSSFSVRAVGSAGSVAVLKFPLPACPPPA